MANFYARDRGYSDYHLALPIEKMAQKELKKGSDKIEALNANAKLAKEQAATKISALNNKYKIQRANLKENWKLAQDNYALIFEQEQENALAQFEALQASRGNPGPKQAQGLGSLMEMAPALAEMVGSYVEQEKIFRNKTTSNLILDKNISGATAAKWAENRELIASNTLEAKIFARHEAAKLGVDISTEEMLSIIDLYGERDMAAMTAFAHNSARLYPLFFEDPANQSMEIVLDGGVTKTWGEIRRGHNPAEFAAAQMQMRGHFLEKHQISITDQVPGILGSIGENIRKVEAQELGRYYAQLNQYNDDRLETHNAIRFQNGFDEGVPGLKSIFNTLAYENLDTVTGKPDYNTAFNLITDWMEKGLKEGTISSQNVQDFIDANGGKGGQWRQLKLDSLLDEARRQEYNALELDRKINQQAQNKAIQREVDFFFSPDGQNGSLSMPLPQWEERMKNDGLTRDSIKNVISQTLSTGGLKANQVEERYKANYDAGQKEAVNSILAKIQNNPANEIVLGDKENLNDNIGYEQLTQRVKMRYHYEFTKLVKTRGVGANDSNIPDISQDATEATVAWLDTKPHYTKLSSPTVRDPVTNEEVQVRNQDRTLPHFTTKTNAPPYVALAIDALNDTPGVSPEQRINGIRKGTYDAVIARDKILTFYHNGEWDVRAFENSTIGRKLSIKTGIPASEILDIHAEEYGLNRPRENEVLTRDELNRHSKGVQQVIIHNSSVANDVANAGLHQEFRQPARHMGIGGGPLNPGFQQVSWEQNPIDTAKLQSTTESGQPRRVSIQQRAELLSAVGFPRELIPVMIAISAGESGGDAGAHNPNRNTGDNSYGLWQINMIDTLGPSRRKNLGLTDNRQLFDPLTNARAAKAIYDSQGLNAWTVYSKGTYKKYLPEVQTTLQRWY